MQGVGGKEVKLTDLSDLESNHSGNKLDIALDIPLVPFNKQQLQELLRVHPPFSPNRWGQKRLLGEQGGAKNSLGSKQAPQLTKLRLLLFIYGYMNKTSCCKNPHLTRNGKLSGQEQRSLQGEFQYKQGTFLLLNTFSGHVCMLLHMRAV